MPIDLARRTSPNAPKRQGEPQPREIALNSAAARLGTLLSERGIEIATIAYRDLDMHPQIGTRAKKTLEQLGYVTIESITVRAGRGGRAVALRPTPSLYKRLKMTRPHGCRGGASAQHEWLVKQLAAIPHATAEFTLGNNKSVDILIAVDPTNEHVIEQLVPKAVHAWQTPPSLNDHVGVEVEVSDVKRTLLRNLEADRDAGLTKIIVAVLPQAIDDAKTIINAARAAADDVLLIDVFRMIETVRQGAP